jgi:3-methyl-2-oxobutanoate hydroxymethyltransferase
MDVLGDPTHRDLAGTDHVPRHARVYRDFAAELARLQEERIAAFREFRGDVESGAFPEARHLVPIADDQLAAFRAALPPA